MVAIEEQTNRTRTNQNRPIMITLDPNVHADIVSSSPSPTQTRTDGTFTFSIFCKYFIFAEALLLVFMLYCGNKKITHR
jgi:hypothetical protein